MTRAEVHVLLQDAARFDYERRLQLQVAAAESTTEVHLAGVGESVIVELGFADGSRMVRDADHPLDWKAEPAKRGSRS